MVRRSPRIDVTVPNPLYDRLTALGDTLGEERNDLVRRALAIGVAAIEAEITQHANYNNALAVTAKLRRMGEVWEEAMGRLHGALSEEESAQVLSLLKRSAGGE